MSQTPQTPLPIWPEEGKTYTAEEVCQWLDRQRSELQATQMQLTEALRRIERLRDAEQERDQLKAQLTEKKATAQIRSPEQIAAGLLEGSISPQAANTALYALQVALTAKRTEHFIAASRQKEERLRSQQTEDQTASRKSKAEKATTPTTPANANPTGRKSSPIRSTSRRAAQTKRPQRTSSAKTKPTRRK
jgi:hypothetical protein